MSNESLYFCHYNPKFKLQIHYAFEVYRRKCTYFWYTNFDFLMYFFHLGIQIDVMIYPHLVKCPETSITIINLHQYWRSDLGWVMKIPCEFFLFVSVKLWKIYSTTKQIDNLMRELCCTKFQTYILIFHLCFLWMWQIVLWWTLKTQWHHPETRS